MSTTVTNVTTITPKTERLAHRRQTIILTYQPADGKWKWRVEYTLRKTISFEGVGKRRQDAVRMAKREIDRLEDGE